MSTFQLTNMKTATPKKSQCQRLLAYLRKNRRGITTMEAFQHLGVCRLSERIREIEAMAKETKEYPFLEAAHRITRTRETAPNGSTVTRYKLSR